MRSFITFLLVFVVLFLQDIEGRHRRRHHHCPKKRQWDSLIRPCTTDDDCLTHECCCDLLGLGDFCLPEDTNDEEDEADSEKKEGHEKSKDQPSGSNPFHQDVEKADDCAPNSDDKTKCRQAFIGRMVFAVFVTISVTVLACLLILCIAKKFGKKKLSVSAAVVNLNVNSGPGDIMKVTYCPDQLENSSNNKCLKELEATEAWAQRVLSCPENNELPPVYTPAAPPEYTNSPPPSYHI